MPTARALIAGLALTLTAISCTDKGPTEANNSGDNTQAAQPQPKVARQPLIFPADQAVTNEAGARVATITSVQITHFALNSANKLIADGAVTYTTAAGQTVTQAFTGAEVQSFTSSGAPTAATCQILNLDIGAIHLDLLGLVVDLAPVHLDITAQSGPGNLLGNLLCALTHLLDMNNIAAITNLLTQINALLAQLL
jgi:hypothetical protein